MHIPDGFLSAPVWVGMDVVSAGAVSVAVKRVNQTLDPDQVALMGMAGAFIFAAQMINFPVAGGTSGHLLGGFLAALLLGPAPAVIVMTTVFTAQCLLFQDGGLFALGANLFNMGLIGSLGGYAVYRLLARGLGVWPSVFGIRSSESGIPHPTSYIPSAPICVHRRFQSAIAMAAWLSVMLGAAAASFEIAASGTAPLRIVLPAMLGVHALIGIGEALITVGAVALLTRVRPELMKGIAR
jgi:cobalt/nickel transport system permease protein